MRYSNNLFSKFLLKVQLRSSAVLELQKIFWLELWQRQDLLLGHVSSFILQRMLAETDQQRVCRYILCYVQSLLQGIHFLWLQRNKEKRERERKQKMSLKLLIFIKSYNACVFLWKVLVGKEKFEVLEQKAI